jgi:hypothetical protein
MESRLGLLRAAIIVWVSGLVAGAFLSLFFSQMAWALLARSTRHFDHRWGLTAALVIADELVTGACVTFGVGLVGFRVSHSSAVVAVGFSGFLTAGFSTLLYSGTPADPTGIALPALGLGFWPVGILLGLVLPAYLIDAVASSQSPAPVPPVVHPPEPPYGE